jgi:hypothetical protein
MTKSNKITIVIFVFVAIILLLVLLIKIPNDLKTPVDKNMSVNESRVGGFFVEFENGTTEPEVKAILKNCNMTMNYIIDYNSDIMAKRYYIIVDKDKRMKVEDELRKDENWTDPELKDITKGNNYIISVTEQAIHDKKFLAILEKNDLHVYNSIWCLITFRDESKNWIWERDASRIKNELEMSEKVLTINLDYIQG